MHSALCYVLLLVLPGIGWARAWTEVPEAERSCAGETGYCYQWRLDADPTLSFVATGDEDGGEMGLYRRAADGREELLAQVFPSMDDISRPGARFWGYPWYLSDVVVDDAHGIRLSVALEHGYTYDGGWTPPAWQVRFPFILFRGATKQANIKVPALTYTLMTIDELARAVRQRN